MSSLAPAGIAAADTFSATYNELARSPFGNASTWYSGAVTKDGTFIYGHGNSHDSALNNGLAEYNPATNTHRIVSPNTGGYWRWDKDEDGRPVSKSGRWATLDPVANKTLYDYFGGPDIKAPTNRNNHQAFYMPGVDQFWILAGTYWDKAGPHFAGRFQRGADRWEHVSKPWSDPTKSDAADFSSGMVAGQWPGWVAANAATAVCTDLDTAVLFGGMSGTGGVRIIEPNPAGPEPYRWASAPKPPIYQPAENVRHNAACVGDTVYFVEGQRRVPNVGITTPNPAAFWKFHVPTRTWASLPTGPSGAYFTVMTHDQAANALLVYGGTGGPNPSNRLWVYDLAAAQWHDLTGTVANLPRVSMHTGGYVPGFGHVYKGGKRFDATGKDLGYTASPMMMRIVLTRNVVVAEAPTPDPAPDSEPTPQPVPVEEPQPAPSTDPQPAPVPPPPAPVTVLPTPADVRAELSKASDAITAAGVLLVRMEAAPVEPPPTPAPDPVPADPAPTPNDPPPVDPVPTDPLPPVPTAPKFAWTQIALPGQPNSPQASMKHQRLAEGPGGRVYILGGDWGGGALGGLNSGRQEVHSFDPKIADGGWRLEAPTCGTVEHPVHWHTDEAGTAWDAKRGVFWKVSGIEYGEDDACLAAGKSVKAKVITFNPATNLWTVPAHVDQTRFGYVTNGVLDAVNDEFVQIIDTQAKHLSLGTGQWASYPLPAAGMRFNVRTAQIGREVWWLNRQEQVEAYNLDTHKTTNHGAWPWPQVDGYRTQMGFNYGGKFLVVSPTSTPREVRRAALYDPATKQWTVIDQGEGWGNTGVLLSDGRLVLMGGGINGPEDHNKVVWVGRLP